MTSWSFDWGPVGATFLPFCYIFFYVLLLNGPLSRVLQTEPQLSRVKSSFFEATKMRDEHSTLKVDVSEHWEEMAKYRVYHSQLKKGFFFCLSFWSMVLDDSHPFWSDRRNAHAAAAHTPALSAILDVHSSSGRSQSVNYSRIVVVNDIPKVYI